MPRPQPGLIHRFDTNAITNDDAPLTDLLLALAANIEDALLQAGARPHKDYTTLDVFKLAAPFALDHWCSEDSKVSIEL